MIITFLTLAFYFSSGKILIISFLTLAFYFFSGKIRIVKANWVYSHIFLVNTHRQLFFRKWNWEYTKKNGLPHPLDEWTLDIWSLYNGMVTSNKVVYAQNHTSKSLSNGVVISKIRLYFQNRIFALFTLKDADI